MSLLLTPDGPGTTIELRDGVQGLPVAPRGTVAIMGRFPSGPVSFAALASTSAQARLVSGSADDDFEASLALNDVYQLSNPLALIGRITDGLEVQSQIGLWDRNPNTSFLHRVAQADRAPLATAKAHNGGRWGGQRHVTAGSGTITSMISGDSTFITGLTLLVDQLEGGSLYIEGDDSGKSYTVTANTTSGNLTIAEEFSATAKSLTGTKHFQVVLSGGKELSVIIGQDNEVGAQFSLKADRKFSADGQWETVTSYANLGLSDSDDKPWIDTITDGEDNGLYQIAVSTDYDGSTIETKLPSNFCEVPVSISGPTMTFQWYRWSKAATNTGNPYVDVVTAISTDFIEPHVYTIVFTDATHASVTATFPDGTAVSLGSLTLASTFSPVHPQLTSIKLRAGGTAAIAGDTITIRVNPLPLDLYKRDAYIYPAALSTDGNASVRLKVVANTYNSVSVRSDLDLADYDAVAMSSPSVTGSADASVAVWAIGQTIILTGEGLASQTFTGTGEAGIAAVIAALTAADTAGVFIFESDAGHLKITLATGKGPSATILVGAGTANATFGLTSSTTYTGTAGVPARLSGRFPMWGGYDGDEPGSSRYVIALDTTSSIFARHMCRNLGLVRVATPGISAQAVKTAAEQLMAQNGWMYIAEFATSVYDSSTPGEAAVAAMTGDEDESDYVEHYFPSHGKFRNVAGTKLVTRSLSGVILGRRSKLANIGIDGEKGLHIAAANNNDQGKLSPIVQGLPDGIGRWTPPIELLNSNGIVCVRWDGNDVFLYGNRMYSAGRTPSSMRYTITERAVFYHVARDLFVTTRPFIFKSISSKRLSEVARDLRNKLKVYWADGWFSDSAGSAFEDQVAVDVPASLNPPENLLDGLVTATVSFQPRPALERLYIIISPTQLSAS